MAKRVFDTYNQQEDDSMVMMMVMMMMMIAGQCDGQESV